MWDVGLADDYLAPANAASTNFWREVRKDGMDRRRAIKPSIATVMPANCKMSGEEAHS